MKVSVIGSGYVGLVTGACLAEKGHSVTCVDVDRDRVGRISRGEAPFFEPGLPALLRRNVGAGLAATTDLPAAVRATELSIIAVGTPFDGTRKDLRQVEDAARQVGRVLRGLDRYHVVVVKSTVPPGTTENLVLRALEVESRKVAGADFGVAMNPEFLREGEAVGDFMNPDRLVFGVLDDRTHDALEELYRGFPGVDRIRVSPVTAEMIKYASNALLATMISFSNEIGNLCAALAAAVDVEDVMRGVHLDRRVSPLMPNGQRVVPGLTSYLRAGCGFGGSCFPKDVKALIASGQAAGLPMRLLNATIRVNEEQPEQIIRLLTKRFPELTGIRVGLLGLAFKPGTDDMRESPTLPVLRRLRSLGAIVKAYDPAVSPERAAPFLNGEASVCGSLDEAVSEVEAVVLLTAWPQFGDLPELLGRLEPQPLLVDGRRMVNKRRVASYEGVGT